VDHLARGEYEQAVERFDAKMKEVLPPDQLREVWQGLVAQVGDFQQRSGVRTETRQGYRLVYVTLQFAAGALDAQVAFDDAGQVAGLFFVPTDPSAPAQAPAEAPDAYVPPDYVVPDAFEERQVVVGDEWPLPATLTLPRGDGPFPAVVLVHGSGPQDRDETTGFYKPFRDLAWGLASRGIAVLRYEKRTKEHAGRLGAIYAEITVQEETVDDALAAVELLRGLETIARDRIFVLGHSLGGMLLPRIAAGDAPIAGLIALAAPSRPLEELFLEQVTYVFDADGQRSDQEQAALDEIEAQVARVQDPDLSPDTPPSELPMDVPASYWLDLRGYDPARAARDLPQPLLVLQGGRDYQVTEEDFRGWQSALSDLDRVEFRFYPDLNHYFVPGEGLSSPEEDYATAGHVARAVVEDIVTWIQALSDRVE
jgi:fermentation-respiration switch protein FrsA (DUF1100 family)